MKQFLYIGIGIVISLFAHFLYHLILPPQVIYLPAASIPAVKYVDEKEADKFDLWADNGNVFFGCNGCHNKSTYRSLWSRLGSQRLHERHETRGTQCDFCHYKPYKGGS
jgi:hypothetical protein